MCRSQAGSRRDATRCACLVPLLVLPLGRDLMGQCCETGKSWQLVQRQKRCSASPSTGVRVSVFGFFLISFSASFGGPCSSPSTTPCRRATAPQHDLKVTRRIAAAAPKVAVARAAPNASTACVATGSHSWRGRTPGNRAAMHESCSSQRHCTRFGSFVFRYRYRYRFYESKDKPYQGDLNTSLPGERLHTHSQPAE